MIKAALFDYGGVLSKSGQGRSVERILGEHWGIDPDKIDITELERQLQRGDITPNDFFDGLAKVYPNQKPVDEQFLLDAATDFYEREPRIYELAQQLRNHGIATGIISNIFPFFAEKIRQQGNFNYFHPVVLSFQEGVRSTKLDRKIYEVAMEHLAMETDEMIYIDDQPKNLEPARELGMLTVHAFSETQLVKAIPTIIKDKNGLRIDIG